MKRTNEVSAEMGRKVEKAYLASGGGDKEDDESTVVDIIADLLHFARHYTLEVNTIIRRAIAHYEAELLEPWSVLLLTDPAEDETYLAHVNANSANDAITKAREEINKNFKLVVACDYAVLLTTPGHIKDYTTR